MKYYLVDSLARLVGQTNCKPGIHGTIEYGRRDKNGLLHTQGHARLVAPSQLTRAQRDNINAGIVPGYRDI